MTIYASTPPRTTDPKPHRDPGGYGHARYADPPPLTSQGERFTEYRPRPEFDQPRAHAVNPILLELRSVSPEISAQKVARYLRYSADPSASSEDPRPWTLAEREHARRVLTRLIRCGGIGNGR